jgi:hypothetical protein
VGGSCLEHPTLISAVTPQLPSRLLCQIHHWLLHLQHQPGPLAPGQMNSWNFLTSLPAIYHTPLPSQKTWPRCRAQAS